jgi:hypothetical protein
MESSLEAGVSLDLEVGSNDEDKKGSDRRRKKLTSLHREWHLPESGGKSFVLRPWKIAKVRHPTSFGDM